MPVFSVSSVVELAFSRAAPWIKLEQRAASLVVCCSICHGVDTFSEMMLSDRTSEIVNLLMDIPAIKKHLSCPDMQRSYLVTEAATVRVGGKMPPFSDWVDNNRPGIRLEYQAPPVPPSSAVPLEAKRQISLEDE